MKARLSRRTAVTFVEILVIVVILAMLLGLTLPAIQKIRDSAKKTACQQNLKQIGIALHSYVSTHGRLPPGAINDTYPWGGPRTAWTVHLYPFLEQENVHRRIDFKLRGPAGALWSDNANSMGSDAPTAAVVKTFLCPSDGLGGTTSTGLDGVWSHSNYLGFFGDWGYGVENTRAVFGINYGASLEEIKDGLSHTMMVGEYLTGVPETEATHDFRGVHWMDFPGSSQLYTALPPNSPSPDLLPAGHCHDRPDLNLPCQESYGGILDTAGARSRHTDGVHVLMADGTVRFVRNAVKPTVWQAMGTIDGGEDVPGDEGTSGFSGRAQGRPIHRFTKPVHVRDQYVVVLHPMANPHATAAEMTRPGMKLLHVYDADPAFVGFAARIPPEHLAGIRTDPRVKYLDQDQIASICGQTVPTGLRRIGADRGGMKIGKGYGPPADVTAVVIDTGIDAGHPDLTVVLSKGFGYPTGHDGHGHGTHVAGTVGAVDNGFGVVGGAPGARLWGIKVLSDAGFGTTSDIIAGVNFITANADKVQVVNMSLGGGFFQPENDAVDACVKRGVVVIIAAGNSSVDAATFSPASTPSAITVAALADSDGRPGKLGSLTSAGPDDTFATFSNYGAVVDVIAPGVDILSTWTGGGYNTISGTSMASPTVAGIAALAKSTNSRRSDRIRNIRPINNNVKFTPAQVEQLLKGYAVERIPGIFGDPLSYLLIRADVF